MIGWLRIGVKIGVAIRIESAARIGPSMISQIIGGCFRAVSIIVVMPERKRFTFAIGV